MESRTYNWGHGDSGRRLLTVARLGGVPPTGVPPHTGSQLNPPVQSRRVTWGLCVQPGQAPPSWQTHRGIPPLCTTFSISKGNPLNPQR